MRLILPALALGVAACTPADKVAEQVGNGAETAGNAAVAAGASLANAVEEGAADIAAPANRDAWVGRWTGVEGTYLVVAKAKQAGRYTLEMQYTLDDKGVFDGTASADGIAFTRPDGPQTLRTSDGDATGLKYLAGKKDCLTVKPGEGYCRD